MPYFLHSTFPPVSNDTNQPDPRLFAPFVVGDYVTASGVWVPDATAPFGSILVIYTLKNNIGFYTTPGTYPAYLTIEALQWGIDGNPAGEIAETRVEGYTTDQTAQIEIFAIDVNPCTGVQTPRTMGVVAPRTAGRKGQWRFRPDAAQGPVTLQVGARMSTIPASGALKTPNGVDAGVFIAPVMDEGFLFPELNLFGQNQIVYEFNLLQFLAQGSGPYFGAVPGREVRFLLLEPQSDAESLPGTRPTSHYRPACPVAWCQPPAKGQLCAFRRRRTPRQRRSGRRCPPQHTRYSLGKLGFPQHSWLVALRMPGLVNECSRRYRVFGDLQLDADRRSDHRVVEHQRQEPDVQGPNCHGRDHIHVRAEALHGRDSLVDRYRRRRCQHDRY